LHYWAVVLAQAAPPAAVKPSLPWWTGDLDAERRTVRVLAPYSRTLYSNEKHVQRGLVAGFVEKGFESSSTKSTG
jgi:hypothetical protein